MTHSCLIGEDWELSRRDPMLEGDLRAFQATLLGSSYFVVGFPDEMVCGSST